jgi:hypothetical protein
MRIRSRLTFGNVMSVIALFIALGGTGYAAITLPKNSVGAKQIKKNGVGVSEIRKNAVRSGEVRNGALRAADFAAGQLPVGLPGPQGPQGPQGVQGGLGTFGSVTTQFEQAATALPDNTKASYDVHCPEGQTGVAGGARGDVTDSEFTKVTSSRPIGCPRTKMVYPVLPSAGGCACTADWAAAGAATSRINAQIQ